MSPGAISALLCLLLILLILKMFDSTVFAKYVFLHCLSFRCTCVPLENCCCLAILLLHLLFLLRLLIVFEVMVARLRLVVILGIALRVCVASCVPPSSLLLFRLLLLPIRLFRLFLFLCLLLLLLQWLVMQFM